MKFILAEKQEMTQKFGADGTVIPVTKVVAGPCVVTQVKTMDKDGYVGIQVGFGAKKKISKPVKGHLKNLGNFRYLKEFRISADEAKTLAVGNKITAATFQSGDIIKVTGTSKGRGFQGVVKRHGFHGSPKSHGHKDQLRMPGSIGATGPAHVFKGTRMGGQMGNTQVTVTNLEIVEIDEAKNEIFIKGAVPGAKNNLLLIAGVGDLVIAVEPVEANSEVVTEEVAEVETVEVSSQPKVAENTDEVKPQTPEVKDENKEEQVAINAEIKTEESKEETK